MWLHTNVQAGDNCVQRLLEPITRGRTFYQFCSHDFSFRLLLHQKKTIKLIPCYARPLVNQTIISLWLNWHPVNL